jgi:hypothetical protein
MSEKYIFYNAALGGWPRFKTTIILRKNVIHQGIAVSSHHKVSKTNLQNP